MFLKKIIFWLMLTREDLEAVACKPIRNTLRFARLRRESETEDGNCRLKRSDLDSERSLLL
jgi:hypothetical protein